MLLRRGAELTLLRHVDGAEVERRARRGARRAARIVRRAALPPPPTAPPPTGARVAAGLVRRALAARLVLVEGLRHGGGDGDEVAAHGAAHNVDVILLRDPLVDALRVEHVLARQCDPPLFHEEMLELHPVRRRANTSSTPRGTGSSTGASVAFDEFDAHDEACFLARLRVAALLLRRRGEHDGARAVPRRALAAVIRREAAEDDLVEHGAEGVVRPPRVGADGALVVARRRRKRRRGRHVAARALQLGAALHEEPAHELLVAGPSRGVDHRVGEFHARHPALPLAAERHGVVVRDRLLQFLLLRELKEDRANVRRRYEVRVDDLPQRASASKMLGGASQTVSKIRVKCNGT